jgi:hypothetical protein
MIFSSGDSSSAAFKSPAPAAMPRTKTIPALKGNASHLRIILRISMQVGNNVDVRQVVESWGGMRRPRDLATSINIVLSARPIKDFCNGELAL